MTAAASQRSTIGFMSVAALAVAAALFQTSGSGLRAPSLEPIIGAERALVLPNGKRLVVQVYEVTVAQWNRCAEAGACQLVLRVRPGQRASKTPATGLSYVDTQEYLAWLNDQSPLAYRLPTVAEWLSFATPVMPEKPDPIFTDPALSWASSYLLEGNASRILKPQGSFSTTPDGIADLNGSVWEWTSDCFAGGAGPVSLDRCPAFYVAGEHMAAMSFLVRDPARGGCAVGTPPAHLGMRLVRDVI